MSFGNDLELINDFHMKSGHAPGSIRSYRTVFNNYCNFHNMSLSELLKEAINEQESNVAENRLKIYDRIVSFRNYLAGNYVGSTISNSISKIKTFYRYNRVRIPFIPPLNGKSIKRNEFISFEDLLTKEELKAALKLADNSLALWIMVMISSGVTRAEAKSMTNQMFLSGTREYHGSDSLEDALRLLSLRNDAVCTCKLVRQKTDKPYYTFLNPECVQMIAKAKLEQEDFDLDKSLLDYELNYVNHKFKSINDALGLGEAGGFSRFRPHMLRKFHATYLNQGSLGDIILDKGNIDSLQGRGSQTREAYFKENPQFLKLEYVKSMNNVSLYHRYDWKIVDGMIMVEAMPI